LDRLFISLLTLTCLLAGGSALAQPLSMAVVYPEVREPYRSVFLEIVRGMEAELGQTITQYVLSDGQETANLMARIKKDRIQAVVTLGRAGYEAAKSLSKELPVVVGAVLLPLGQNDLHLSGVSLTPDPAILFARLKELAPQARDVTVIYDPQQNSGELSRARNAAQARSMSLQALESTDLRQSAALYQKVLREIKEGSAAIWLPQNNLAMDDQALLPLVLRAAWEQRFVVFSGNLDHVKKGALFSLYPDNFGMGRSLAILARKRLSGPARDNAGIEPLRDLLLAVNIRTAEHLGLRFSTEAIRTFGMTFPPRP
jgi:putative ABC transport system substrate-binding protein